MNRIWRSCITIFCFIAFGIGGTLMSSLLMPLLMLLPGSAAQRRYRARSVIGFCFRLLVRGLVASGCMRLNICGLDRLTDAGSSLILANHPTYIDVVVLISLMPQANCVVKSDLWRNPFYWGIVRAAGYINNASPEALISACAEALSNGETLLLFPEGTRSTPGEALRFQRGAAHVAIAANAPFIPVLVTCEPPTLTKRSPWWLAPTRPFTFGVDIRESMQGGVNPRILSMEAPAIGARYLTQSLEDYFSRELKRYGYA